MSNQLANGDNLENTNTNIYKKEATFLEINWKVYRIFGFIFFGLSFFIMKYIVDYFEERFDDEDLVKILKIVSFFFILNFGTFLFITVYYKYRKSIKGTKGPPGPVGKRGIQGKSNSCNICSEKVGTFKREQKMEPIKEEVDQSVVVTRIDTVQPEGWVSLNNHIEIHDGNIHKSFIVFTPVYLGLGGNIRRNYNDSNIKQESGKPIIGVSASYNENTGELYSIMYFFDGNIVHNKNRYKYKPKLDSVIGRIDKKGVGVEFKAPPNSAIYKVEVFNNGSIIKSVRFYCASIDTGKPINVLDPSTNKMRRYATIGKKVNAKDKRLNMEGITAGNFYNNKKYYQTFISKFGGYPMYNSNDVVPSDIRVDSLGYMGCSVFMPRGSTIEEVIPTTQA